MPVSTTDTATSSFQSTLPAWGETRLLIEGDGDDIDFNPLSPHGERHGLLQHGHAFQLISIHSPRMGRDQMERGIAGRKTDFNPLSPHGERPLEAYAGADGGGDFNPLSPHGERQRRNCTFRWTRSFQSTLPAWGETGDRGRVTVSTLISIHSPRMGRDVADHGVECKTFQSTLPAWGETTAEEYRAELEDISIHSPRMGRDPADGAEPERGHHFNPLSPHGERPSGRLMVSVPPAFQSTLPAWGETATSRWPSAPTDFNPLSPHGERPPSPVSSHRREMPFQSTLPAWGETSGINEREFADLHFNPLSPHGERPSTTSSAT